MIQRIWEYYGELARVTGRKSDGTLRPYSLESVFYNGSRLKDAAAQNELVRAFLGDKTVQLAAGAEDVSEERLAPFLSSVTPPYAEQIRAIQNALTNPISLIQGPPGTGKTEMILNLISAIRNIYPDKTIAVVSCNAEAIRNIIEKIQEGKDKDSMLADIHKRFAVLGSSKVRLGWKGYLESTGFNTDGTFDDFGKIDPSHLEMFPIFSSTIHSLRRIFSTKSGFDNQFDYVIADECSQVSITLGLAAMSCAKNLVLIGDTNQLPPIIPDHARELNREYDDIPDVYKETDGKSFLSACEEVFGDRISSVMLDMHYRCHPSIIGFCNEYVYDGRLKIMSRDDGEFRIRAVWYEGEYCENIKTPEQGDIDGKRNMRQIEIFMREELPRIKEALLGEPQLSVCVISPFRVQLAILQKKLLEAGLEAQLEQSDPDDNKTEHILKLTAHRSQGKGFDMVYMFTVEDYVSSPKPWCQQKRLVNVAVSRSKKEFCIITSAQWLPERLQQELSGYILPVPASAENDKDEMFYCKMLRYISEHCPEPRGEFGLHKASMTSVFDKIPFYRQLCSTGRDCKDVNSAPSHCMRDALRKKYGDTYSILYEVPLKFIEQTETAGCTDEALLDFRESSALDIVLCMGKEIRAIIEVDGAYHRLNEYRKKCDEKKDRWLRDILKADSIYLRFPTDGTSDSEMDIIERALNSPDDITLTIKDEAVDFCRTMTEAINRKELLLQELHSTVSKCLEGVKKKTEGSISEETEKELGKMNYRNADEISYDEELGKQFYLCRYGIAYAFEYALMYELVMRSYMKNGREAHDLGVFSFGSGALPDAWAMAYSKARLTAEDISMGDCRLYYKGIDIASWNDSFISEEIGAELFKNFKLFNDDINEFIDRRLKRNVYHNILMFPKILNELSDDYIEKMTQKLRSCNYSLDEYYVCISHSRSHFANGGAEAAEKIVGAINHSNEFEVCSNIYEMTGESTLSALKTWNISPEDEPIDITSPENREQFGGINTHLSCYVFRSSLAGSGIDAAEISEINPDFTHQSTEKYMKALALRLPEVRAHQNVRVSQMVFQIIRLRRK
ncbi:MAG: AAA domain-containing protein [Oscillospiraceae bacterium]|nr:AAA domain-containing protein [Oscillospiraceae bacterium]